MISILLLIGLSGCLTPEVITSERMLPDGNTWEAYVSLKQEYISQVEAPTEEEVNKKIIAENMKEMKSHGAVLCGNPPFRVFNCGINYGEVYSHMKCYVECQDKRKKANELSL